MILKSFGCSFIYGSDLIDDRNGKNIELANSHTWPTLLANFLGHRHECYARPGSGNLQILERLLEQINKGVPAVYVISWSWIDRFDYIDDTVTWPGTKWNTLLPAKNDSVTRCYYKNLNSQYQDKLTSLIYIRDAIDTLNKNHCPFIMTYMDDLIFETQWHSTSAITDLQNYVRPYMTTFENQTFLDWSKKKGFAISNNNHPLEDAHQAAFELIKSYNLV